MGKKLGHIVNTRCGFGWDLSGKSLNMGSIGGYSIYSISKDIIEEKCDKALRDVFLNHQHDRDAYVYCVPEDGRPMLAAYRKRTNDERAAAEKADVDTRASYISEWLVGDFERYSFEYMGSPFWKNIYRPIADFYMGEGSLPLGEPIDADAVPTAGFTREEISAFAADGRASAVKAAVWALLKQYDLPASKRKFLVIRDEEENVRKWIAAVGYSLPIQAFNQISYNTGMIKLNEETDCCYYIQNSTGAYVRSRNIQDPNLERRWFYMIAGADASDASSGRTASAAPNAPYLVIDGYSKQAKFETDALLLKPFISDIAANPARITDFCSYMNELKDIRIGTGICDLYDAQITLTDETKWSYSALYNALSLLQPHFTAQSILMRYIVSRLCKEGQYAARFACEDEASGLRLFGILYKLAAEFDKDAGMPVIRKQLVNRIGRLLENSRETDALRIYADCLKQLDRKLYTEIITELVDASNLDMVTESSVESGTSTYIKLLFEIVDTYLSAKNKSWTAFFKEPVYRKLTDGMIARSLNDEALPGYVLKLLSGDSKAIDSYILRGCRFCEESNMTVRWWRTILQNKVNPEYVCALIHDNGIDIQEIENVLCQEIRINGYSPSLKKPFNQYLARIPGAGNAFYREWINSISNTKDKASALKPILLEIASNSNYSKLLSETLGELDCEITLEKSKEMTALSNLICEVAARARVRCDNALLRDYLCSIAAAKLSRRDKDGIAGVFLQINADGFRYTASDNMLRSQLYVDYLGRLEEYIDQPATHIIALSAIKFRNENARRYNVKQYAKLICGDTLKKKGFALASVIYLREVITRGLPTNDAGTEKLRRLYSASELMGRLDELLSSVQDELGNHRTDNIAGKVLGAIEKEFDGSIAKKAERMFTEARETYELNNKGQGLFSKLFGRPKK